MNNIKIKMNKNYIIKYARIAGSARSSINAMYMHIQRKIVVYKYTVKKIYFDFVNNRVCPIYVCQLCSLNVVNSTKL